MYHDPPLVHRRPREAEIERLIALGATRADVGQGPDVSWDLFVARVCLA